MLAQLSAMPTDERAAASARLQAILLEILTTIRPRIVFAFVPLSTEPDCLDAIASSHTVAIPRVEDDKLVFQLRDENSRLIKTKLGVMEPVADPSRVAKPTKEDAILVPGLAFDADGFRLGRGRGFYDRFLGGFPRWTRIGIAFACQIVKEVPREPHDVKLDQIISA